MVAKFILSKSKVLEQFRTVEELSDEVSYSVKTNPALVEILEDNTNSKFSMHFSNSIVHVKDKSRIIFLSQSWNEDDVSNLIEKGIKNFTVDNENDLNVLLNYLEKNDVKVNLFLRMRLKERTIHTERHFVYGMYSNQINELIPKLRRNEKIEKLGVHFHRKTENVSEWNLKEELSDILKEETLQAIDIMNIGGGIPIPYKNHKVDVLPYIFNEIKELRAWLNSKNIKMIIEPGRFLAGPSMKLETDIINIYNNNVIINCSVYNSAMDTFIAHIRLLVDGEKDFGDAYTIKGFTPDSLDVFRYRIFLNDPKIGDKITFLNAGAYIFSTNFCDLEKPEIIVVE